MQQTHATINPIYLENCYIFNTEPLHFIEENEKKNKEKKMEMQTNLEKFYFINIEHLPEMKRKTNLI